MRITESIQDTETIQAIIKIYLRFSYKIGPNMQSKIRESVKRIKFKRLTPKKTTKGDSLQKP